MSLKYYKHNQALVLESGRILPDFTIAYHTFGKLNKEASNVVWVTHALTANSDVFNWWKGLFGENSLFNPNEYFIVCANVLGSHYGSTGPLSINPDTGSPYYHNFPEITVRDMVAALNLLREYLQLKKIHTLIGGSLGGQQALEWSITNPQLIENLILIATNAQHSPWGIAFNESQRLAIAADRTWYNHSHNAGAKGLKAARSIALLSYRNYNTYLETQKDDDEKINNFKALTYQQYQGEKLVNRFNAFSYWYLSKAMDSHHVGRKRGGIEMALSLVKSNTLIIAVDSDILFPVSESETLYHGINGSKLEIINSLYGHDGFLIETKTLTEKIEKQLKKYVVYE
ncbi:MAG: homoserine O-acetyltransferase [Bacteroidetes bacterium]|nr:homoserine O-acetyltransferase [Bacteroidota bacterium]MBV6460794.1 Homoserine O-acetyltransferase [Flavobacteriales bacterium]WKZ75795.1 MAG: homoserine O-acetyltransferase [Vicingaceae bacterium]MCL4816661.1 homoserine O-acetyltransferase [Flavobacteriales bacterium]NOG95704.1 homoserine O-acetyltransferase [Bacteroidota bacterium]